MTVVSVPGAPGVVWHTAAAEKLAAAGRWEQAYRHLRAAARLLNGQPGVDERGRHEQLVALLGDPAAGVALLDVDHFTQVNDSYGRSFGDRILQRLVAVLDAGLPDGAFCARYGDEEFAIVLPGRDRHDAVRVCEAARERVERHPWAELAPGLCVTVSIGVAYGYGPVPGRDRLVAVADGLRYAARNAGGNAVAFHDAHTGLIRLAGPAGSRRSLRKPPVAAPHYGSGASAP